MANVTIPDLTANNAPSTNTLLEVSDSSATPVSGKATPGTLVPLGLDMANLVAFTDTSGALSVESTVADGVNAVAASFDTSNALNNAGAKLVSIKNNGTEKSFFDRLGALKIGGNIGDGIDLSVLRDEDNGEEGTKAYLTFRNTANNSWNFFCDLTESGGAQLQVDYDSSNLVWAYASPTEALLFIAIESSFLTKLLPAVPDGANAIAYLFDTSVNLSNAGAKIASFKKVGEERMAISATASAGQTNLLLYDPDNNTMQRVTLGAADSGGSGYRVLRIPNAP